MKSYVIVDNVRCNGCAATIKKEIEKINTVSEVHVEIETGKVSFTCEDDNCRFNVATTLKKSGYPLAGKGSKIDAAKSVISCVKGKITNLTDK